MAKSSRSRPTQKNPVAKAGAKTRNKTTAKKATRSKANPSAVVTCAVSGLSGKGLLQLGRESKLELRDRLAMPRPLFGRLVNLSERTIAKVEATGCVVEKLKRPYNEIYRLLEALGDVVDPKSLGLWFQTPNDAFDTLKPLEVIERGEIDRLWDMVFRLRSGMPG